LIHSRFSNIVAALAGQVRRDAGISCHEHGIDGWEVSFHRSLAGTAEPPPYVKDGSRSFPENSLRDAR
jgi:hypothetical protein